MARTRPNIAILKARRTPRGARGERIGGKGFLSGKQNLRLENEYDRIEGYLLSTFTLRTHRLHH